jgi:TPR repeat protein
MADLLQWSIRLKFFAFFVAAVMIPLLVACNSPMLDCSVSDFDLHQMLINDIGIPTRSTLQVYMLEQNKNLDPKAQASLASYYYVGVGTAEDTAKAAELFKKAAEAGNSKAQLCLGILYSKGEGVDQSETDAYKWLLIAAQSSDKYGSAAIELAKHLAIDLSLDEQDFVRSEVTKWLERIPKTIENKRHTNFSLQ